ncbi:MAG: hypothetical protein M1820_002996 [Bogoriella megaspora]|nr:MAG: hypothetical protein M1820_002996 [Bogoriella megaspora]
MADTIRIPSPTTFLSSPTTLKQSSSSTLAQSKSLASPSKHTPTGNTTDYSISIGVPKPKQTKSRDGCATCKKKRLKCDETKPACLQCMKRNVQCGGYAKDYKWRIFEEPQRTQKSTGLSARKASFTAAIPTSAAVSQSNASPGNDDRREGGTTRPALPGVRKVEQTLEKQALQHCLPNEVAVPSSEVSPQDTFTGTFLESNGPFFDVISPADELEDDLFQQPEKAPANISSMQTPPFPGEDYLGGYEIGADFPDDFSQGTFAFGQCDDLDHGVRFHDELDNIPSLDQRPNSYFLQGKPSPLDSFSPSESRMLSTRPQIPSVDSFAMMLRQPQVPVGCPDVLAARFDRLTCGILSVKDGPTENGWRTLIWPMAVKCPPLYHALAALTSFHAVKQVPSLRKSGIEHLQASLNGLRSDLPRMEPDAAVATSLALAFAESWDKKVTTGIDHIQGANFMLHQALTKYKAKSPNGHELRRLHFLCSTWVYMDVIARLTSTSSDDPSYFDEIYSTISSSWSKVQQSSSLLNQAARATPGWGIDTLMGCAASLFPIIGRTAGLISRVYRATTNNAPIIATAAELKAQLENWTPFPAATISAPEDNSTSVDDCIKTAEAYRWATLLHLFQGVPEVANRSSHEIATTALNLLATVPLTSRAVIIQIFPLLAAGCEMADLEMRRWVKERWERMAEKMGIGVIDASQSVLEEVWRRRDQYENRNAVPEVKPNRGVSQSHGQRPLYLDIGDLDQEETIDSAKGAKSGTCRKMVGGMDFQYTVKGSLHWLGVMQAWNWEILLG